MTTSPVILEDVTCPMGCARDDILLFTGRDRLYGLPGEFSVVQCRICHLTRTNPRPTPDAMGASYPSDYGPYVASRVQIAVVPKRTIWQQFRSQVFRSIFRFNVQVIPRIKPGRMLEIGCASGSFLAYMHSKRWQVEGIEFSDDAAKHARAAGFKVQTGALEDAVAADNAYDLIVGWMVVEHLHSPVQALAKLYTWAKPGAWLCISVPNIASFEFSAFRASAYTLHLPHHLYHFDPFTARAVLLKAGWRVERVFHQRTIGSLIGSFGNWVEDRGGPAAMHTWLRSFPERGGLFSALALYPFAWVFSLFGQTGRMTIWARKP